MKKFLIVIAGLVLTQNCMAQNIVATIKPVHSIVQNILGDTIEAKLLIDNNSSAHNYQLKPSDIKLINKADVVFYIDPTLESFISRITGFNTSANRFVQLTSEDGLVLLEPRSDSHGHDHEHDIVDTHIWLDPVNAKIIAKIVFKTLSAIYPENKEIYETNLIKTIEKLEQLDSSLKAKLEPIEHAAFITQHDAYQYFDKHYNLNFIRAISLDASIPPSVKLTQNLRISIENNNVKCIFSEPQYSDRLVKAIVNDARINAGILDPIGIDLNPGETLYFDLLTNLANNFVNCLVQTP